MSEGCGAWKLRGYVIEQLLGSGASGEVWRAHVAATGDAVALKRLSLRDREQVRRAHAEAAMLSVLDHPHLVRLHALVPDDDSAVLVLDLADGGSLADLLAARGRLTPGEVITAVAPVAAALAYLHAEGVTHGDVSAANVLFTGDGVPLLADLGVARLIGDDTDADATPAYLDPAVAAGCIPGPQSDVFSLAAVALHALTGQPVWRGATSAEALGAARVGVLDDVDERLAEAGVAPEMAAVLVRALSVDPHRRGTAADLALELRYSGEPVAVELSAGRERPEPIPWRARHLASPVMGSAAPSAPDANPGSTGDRAGAPPPTRAVKAPPRPVIPRSPHRRTPRGALPVAAALVVAAVVVVLSLLWPSSSGGTRPPGSDAAAATGPAASAGSAGAEPADSAASWRVVLRSLDDDRGRAFAQRDPELLRRVYVTGPLLQADTHLLLRLVPRNCILRGVRSNYSSVHARRDGSRVRITAHATLAASDLVCPGREVRHAAGAGPATLRITLVHTRTGLRIADQQVSDRS